MPLQAQSSLSYIVILHQTTTHRIGESFFCQLSYIVILHQTTTQSQTACALLGCLISLFYIKPQPQRCFPLLSPCCLISLFYIKPQLTAPTRFRGFRCLISLFYIKPQPDSRQGRTHQCCLISLFYIKPQPKYLPCFICEVVLYRYSTSNHNCSVLSITSTMLSYIVILHQTTTIMAWRISLASLSYIVTLHQTTTRVGNEYSQE